MVYHHVHVPVPCNIDTRLSANIEPTEGAGRLRQYDEIRSGQLNLPKQLAPKMDGAKVRKSISGVAQ